MHPGFHHKQPPILLHQLFDLRKTGTGIGGFVDHVKSDNKISPDLQADLVGPAWMTSNSLCYVILLSLASHMGQHFRLEIHGTEGTVILEGERIVYRGVREEEEYRPEEDAGSSSGSREPMDINLGLVVSQVRDFCDAILLSREPSITMEDGRRAVATVLAIYESAKTGNIVRLDEFAG